MAIFDIPKDRNQIFGGRFVLSILFFSSFTMSIQASQTYPDDEGFIEIAQRVDSGKVQEECLLIRSGQVLEYRFASDHLLEFNFHYHDKARGEVVYVFGPSQIISQPTENRYVASVTRVMCLMWENKGTSPVRLRYAHRTAESE